jgi:hypothetical protein
MLGGLLDEPELIGPTAGDVGLDAAELEEWCGSDEVKDALQADIDAGRSPSPVAHALDHKLGGPRDGRRYTAPSYEITRPDPGRPRYPASTRRAYEAAIASLAPELVRRPKPAAVEEALAWAGEPLATAEVAAIPQIGSTAARAALSRVVRPTAAGADFY